MDVGGEGCGGEEEVGRRAEEVGGGARWHRQWPGVYEGGVGETNRRETNKKKKKINKHI